MSRISDEEMRSICIATRDRLEDAFSDAYDYVYPDPDVAEYFDKWLEGHDRRVAQAERERIVKEIDASPAVLWAGKGGAKERILGL